MLSNHLEEIQNLSNGMDVLIISVTSEYEEQYWEKRLDQMRGQVIKNEARIITVYEDWDQGAGNALGTLYAFLKAEQKSKLDLREQLEEGRSVAIYHTAGKGTRLSPLTGCEYNNKSRIKLASPLREKDRKTPITILEAVIKQTSILAPYRKGRLSVFWGDQIFIPSDKLAETNHDIDLLVKPISGKPDQKEWEEKGYSKYGFVIVDQNKQMKQLEKLSYDEFASLSLDNGETLAFSLGSFSLSSSILKEFLSLFEKELTEKKEALDSDPHLWMPLSLDEELYIKILEKKGTSVDFAKKHYQRMQTFKNNFKSASLLGASSMGEQTLWFDYGNMQSYYDNHLKLVSNTPQGEALRQFFGLQMTPDSVDSKLKVENSILINCSIVQGQIKNSILINVVSHDVDIKDSLVMGTSAQSIEANQSILYNAMENGKISLLPNQVRADSTSKEHGHIKFYNTLHPHLTWDQPVEGNPLSFKDLHQFNQQTNPVQGQQIAQVMHNKIKQAVFDLQK